MAKFTTRVELHSANSSDYETLHGEMENQGFTRTIKGDDDKEYHLPEAEYNYDGNQTQNQVLEKAQKAAAKTKKSSSILVTESNGRTWSGLKLVK